VKKRRCGRLAPVTCCARPWRRGAAVFSEECLMPARAGGSKRTEWAVFGVGALLALCNLTACSEQGQLTTQDAEAQIRAKIGLTEGKVKNETAVPLTVSWEGICDGQSVGPCGPDKLDKETKGLIADGLITMTFDGETSRLALTDKAQAYADGKPASTMMDDLHGRGPRKYTIQNVWISTLEFGAVTAIQQSSSLGRATVSYTLIRKATPFGNRPLGNVIVIGRYNDVTAGPVPQTASFSKVGDGWKIQ
jgi:hypothetical protein